MEVEKNVKIPLEEGSGDGSLSPGGDCGNLSESQVMLTYAVPEQSITSMPLP